MILDTNDLCNIRQTGDKVGLLGYVDAKSDIWVNRVSNNNGCELINHLHKLGMKIITPDGSTRYWRTGS